MTIVDDSKGLDNSIIDNVSIKTKTIFMEFLEEIKKEHNLSESITELECKYFTTYLYILKYTFMYCTRPDNLRGTSAYIQVRDWEDFKFQVKNKAKNLINTNNNDCK